MPFAAITTRTAPNDVSAKAAAALEMEARALLARLKSVKPFALQETTVAAAALTPAAQSAIDRHLIAGRRQLHRQIIRFLRWLRSDAGRTASPPVMQRRFTMLRLRFNASLTQLDIFADAITQRSEYETGVWLAGLDVLAADALNLAGGYYKSPPAVCYLDRGHGAAIRRARTRLPGGDENPVAVIRVPRERMIGSGIASSLIHEVGHQAAALLDLVESLRPVLLGMQKNSGGDRTAWRYWERCISEIVADFWSVARLGITATIGLMGVVALPRYFVFRLSLDDPHPLPWIRVKLSCAMGRALYPHRQWDELERLWESLYPPVGLDAGVRQTLGLLERTMPGFAEMIVQHRPKALRGASLKEALEVDRRRPAQLRILFEAWRASPVRMRRAPPSLVFAVIGQARAESRLSPEEESRILTKLLTHWALRAALDTSAGCANVPATMTGRSA
ncbi:MAG: hypothetical protein ABI977_09385 [Acidobacteriota bacterium]